MEDLPTIISDNYPHFDSLECQFFDDCQFYSAGNCQYNQKCPQSRMYQGKKNKVRDIFRDVCENYVAHDNLKFQVKLMNNPPRDDKKRGDEDL